MGIAFIYSQTGQLAFTALAEPVTSFSEFYHLGILLLLVGIAFKLSLVPFHMWTPDVYQGAPTPITMLMATVSKLAMFTVLLKCWFGLGYASNAGAQQFITVIAILSMLVGNVLALKQENLKRLFAYSSIAHMGYLLIVLLLTSKQDTTMAWQSLLFYFAAYFTATIAVFTAVFYCQQQKSGLSPCVSDVNINDWQGLFWQNKLLAMLVIVSILSLAGIPLTMGFIGKFYLLSYASETQQWALIAALVIGSGISLYYYLRVIFVLFAEQEPRPGTEAIKSHQFAKLGSGFFAENLFAKAFSFLLIGLSVFFGLFPDAISLLLQDLSIA